MARIPRLINSSEPTIYHLMSRTALDGFPLGDVEKEYLLHLMKKFSGLFFVDVLGFCIMGNHFHLVVKMNPEENLDDSELKRRLAAFYGDDIPFSDDQLPMLKKKLCDISEYVRIVKQSFSRYFNKLNKRTGFFWGGRFKSVIVEKGETLINLLAYVDLNPVRAGIVTKPEKYRWSSIGHHLQTDNADGFLSTEFGLSSWELMSHKERLRAYRKFVYEAGGIRSGKKAAIPEAEREKARKNGYAVSRTDRFRNRTRYFTDSAVIGTKAFIKENAARFRDVFEKDKRPRPVSGFENMFSIKRLD